jgi:HAD superfamily hydrolase (TIGR01509 family)
MKGAIFDVDGTILDSMNMWVDITDDFFKEHGIDISREEVVAYQGMSFEESLVQVHDNFLPDMSVKEMLDEFSRRAERAYLNTVMPKDGVCEYIRSLFERGVKIAVATSGYSHLCKAAFKRIGIYPYVSEYAFSSEVGCSKTNPDVYLLAAKRIELLPQECTVFEDILAGARSAKSAGFNVITVADSTNVGDRDELIKVSDRFIERWDELI